MPMEEKATIYVGDIVRALEEFAPPALQEDYDNSGMQVGSRSAACTGVLLCVDVLPETIDEAIARRCNLIVSHHPLIFKGLKSLTGTNPQQTAIMNAIAAGVSVYSCHTSLDNTVGGVSHEMARRLGVSDPTLLERMRHKMMKLATMVPDDDVETVRMALFEAGAIPMSATSWRCTSSLRHGLRYCFPRGARVRSRRHCGPSTPMRSRPTTSSCSKTSRATGVREW